MRSGNSTLPVCSWCQMPHIPRPTSPMSLPTVVAVRTTFSHDSSFTHALALPLPHWVKLLRTERFAEGVLDSLLDVGHVTGVDRNRRMIDECLCDLIGE